MTSTPHAHAEVVAILQDMMHRLRDPHASVKGLLAHLGPVEQRQEGAGYDIRPHHKQFRSLFLGLLSSDSEAEAHAPAEEPYYIDVSLRPDVRLHLADLTPAFGKWRHGIPNPEGNPFVLWFDPPHPHEPASPYQIHMSVFFSDTPEKAGSYVTSLSFKREKHF